MKTFLLTAALVASTMFAINASAHQHGGKGHKQGKIGKMFERTDANQDGQLDLAEYLAHAEQRFKAMDLNQDGLVTKEEGREAHKKMREERREKRKARRAERQSEAGETE